MTTKVEASATLPESTTRTGGDVAGAQLLTTAPLGTLLPIPKEIRKTIS